MMTFHHIPFGFAHSFRRLRAAPIVLTLAIMGLLACGPHEVSDGDSPSSKPVTETPAPAVISETTGPAEGASVAHLELTAKNGVRRSLAQIADGRPLVLAWYQSAGTRGCEMECRSIDRVSPRLSGAGVSVAVASMDPVDANADFAEAMGVDLTLWSDPGGKTAAALGVVHPSGRFPQRWTFYIDPTGMIRHVDREVDPGQPEVAIFEQLRRLGWAQIARTSGNGPQ